MPKEATVHRVRKGTKSCIECRQRKIRCIWLDESSKCDGCKARGRSCQAQVFSTPATDGINLTSRDRINHLEGEINALWSVVKDLQAGRNVQIPSTTAVSASSSVRGETDHDEFSPSNAPAHLRQLFNNGLLDTRESDEDEDSAVRGAIDAGVYHAETRNLQRLLPSREDVAAISRHSSAALALYHALFTRLTVILRSEDMVAQYDDARRPDAHPNRVANLLLSLALTAQQIPPEEASVILTSIKDVPKFIGAVTSGFEKNIANNDTLGGTMEGIETSLVYTRLMLAFADLKKVYLSLRRVIALAELHGLPRAARAAYNQSTSNTPPTPGDERNKSAAALWSSICAADRFAGLMFNVPVATAGHPLPHAPLLLPGGQIHAQAYFTRLGEIAIQIQQLDGGYGPELSESQRFAKVRDIDQQLQSLAGLTPHPWWTIDPSPQVIKADHLVQIWHQYFTIRVHLQLALSDGASIQYHQSFVTCASACENMGLRYIALRPNVPSGFACRMLDIQILTAGVFLLSVEMGVNNATSYGDYRGPQSRNIVDQLLVALDAASQKSGGDIAKKAAATLRSLRQLWKDPDASESQDMALRVPLLGKVRVRRKNKTTTPGPQGPGQGPSPSAQQYMQPQPPQQYPTSQSQAQQSTSMPALWSMDLMEDIPSMPDTMFDMEQWFSNTDFSDASMAFPLDSGMY